MGTLVRSLIVSLLILTLVEAPVSASAPEMLGVVMQADHASLRALPVTNGATLYDGDLLSTDAKGTLRARLGYAQLYLLGATAARLHRTPELTTAALERGTLVLATSGAQAIELQASEARIRPKGTQPVLCQVTLVGPYELLVTSQRGELQVNIGEEVHTVPEATSYRVLIDGPGPAGAQGPRVAARSHFLWIALIGIGVGTGIGIWRALVSPDAP